MNNWTNLLWEALPAISVFLPFSHSGCNITQLAAIAYINNKPDKMISTLIGDAYPFNSSPPRPNGRHFTGGIFKCIFLNGLKKALILIKISLKSIANGPISNIPASVHIMAWHRPGDKPLSEPMHWYTFHRFYYHYFEFNQPWLTIKYYQNLFQCRCDFHW